MAYPNFKLRKETTLPFLEWDPLKSSGFTLPQDMQAKSRSRPDRWRGDEWVWSQSSKPPLSQLLHRLLEAETEMTPSEPVLCCQGKMDGFLFLSPLFMTEGEFTHRSSLWIHRVEWMSFVPDWNGFSGHRNRKWSSFVEQCGHIFSILCGFFIYLLFWLITSCLNQFF